MMSPTIPTPSGRDAFRWVLVALLVTALAVVTGAVLWVDSRNHSRAHEESISLLPADGITVGPDGTAQAAGHDAPTLEIYFDPMCSYCVLLETINGEGIDQLRRDGDVTLVYRPVAFLETADEGGQARSELLANAIVTVAHEAPQAAADFIDTLMEHQALTMVDLDEHGLRVAALNAGVPEDVADTFADMAYADWVQESTDLMEQRTGMRATPQLWLDGSKLEVDWMDPEAIVEAVVGSRA